MERADGLHAVGDAAAGCAPPAAPQPSSPRIDSELFKPLLYETIKLVMLVVIGYVIRRTKTFSSADIEGLSAFVARVALPALICLNVRNFISSLLCPHAF